MGTNPISKKEKRICEYCGNTFEIFTCWVKKGGGRFCSKECHNLGQKKRLRKECVVCGDLFEVRQSENKKYSTCAKAECRRQNKTGKNNPNYKGGHESRRAINTHKYKKWRKQVFERDDYTCQFCGKRGGDLEADHIRPWALFETLRYVVNNGRTLCNECHKTTFSDLKVWRGWREKNPYMTAEELIWIGVDFDGVLAMNSGSPYFLPTDPLPGAKEGLIKITDLGYKPIIFTARPWAEYDIIETWLTENKMPFRRIICGKPLLVTMIDDRNIEFRGDWNEVLEKVKAPDPSEDGCDGCSG